MSHDSVARSVRLNKEKYPERYCAHKDCLWRVSSGHCPRHPELAVAPEQMTGLEELLRESIRRGKPATS